MSSTYQWAILTEAADAVPGVPADPAVPDLPVPVPRVLLPARPPVHHRALALRLAPAPALALLPAGRAVR